MFNDADLLSGLQNNGLSPCNCMKGPSTETPSTCQSRDCMTPTVNVKFITQLQFSISLHPLNIVLHLKTVSLPKYLFTNTERLRV